MKRDTFLRTYHYFIESYLLYIVIFLYYMFSNTLPPIIPFITLVGGTGLLVFILFLKSKKQSFLAFFMAAVVILLIGIALNYQLELLIILTGFMLWRIPILVNEADRQNEGKILVVSFLVGIIYFISSSMMEYPFRNLILILTALQVLFIIIGRFIKGMMTDSYTNEQTRKKQTNWLIKMIGITTGVIALLAISLPAIKWIFFFLLKTIFLVLSIPFMPFLYWLMSIESLRKYWEPRGGVGIEEDEVLEGIFEDIEAKQQVDFSTIWAVISVIIAIIVAVIIYKKYRNLAQGSERQNDSLITRTKSSDMLKTGQSIFRRRQKPPKDYVRKLFFDLENIGAKKRVGRRSAETAKQWFDRVGLSDHYEVIQSYEKVRYDETLLSKEEIEKYDIVIKEIKEKLNDKDD